MGAEMTDQVSGEDFDIILMELLSSLTSDFERELLAAYMASPSQNTIGKYLDKNRSNMPDTGDE